MAKYQTEVPLYSTPCALALPGVIMYMNKWLIMKEEGRRSVKPRSTKLTCSCSGLAHAQFAWIVM